MSLPALRFIFLYISTFLPIFILPKKATLMIYLGISRTTKSNPIYLIHQQELLSQITDDKNEIQYIQHQLKYGNTCISFLKNGVLNFVVFLKELDEVADTLENVRKEAAQLVVTLNKHFIKEVSIFNLIEGSDASYVFAEAMVMANYQFLDFKNGKHLKKNTLESIYFAKDDINTPRLEQLKAICQAIYHVRDLVNTPFSHQTPIQFSEQLKSIAKEGRYKCQVWDKKKIQSNNMGGLLAVSSGSLNEPTFNILEHRPTQYVNKQPIVLVGKGVVYDTGGLSLKPTKDSMDYMKSDMAGAALVAGILYVAGTLNLPLHIIGLIPATDNRPGQNAYAPGDVITMADQTTVEILNTDAEGRLILADALIHAKQLKPEVVIDFATLTGAAAAITGGEAMCMMGTASDTTKQILKRCSIKHYERFVELPLWKEYGDMIKSEVADIKNIGGPTAGAITASKFLEHFTDYPWLHFDIAGVAFTHKPKAYHPYGGTAFGLRMMIDFLLHYNA
jgi:leucyl aminopeptidase